jgi:hypothetical protein
MEVGGDMLPGQDIFTSIRQRGVSIYDKTPEIGAEDYYSNQLLESRLQAALVGTDALANVPVRTRSKLAKILVAETLGYVTPTTFTKVQPRFPHPNLDIYVQKSRNLQIWNEDLEPSRRYVIIGLDSAEVVFSVKVLTGADLMKFDTTGTLTRKFQAKRKSNSGSKLVNTRDTNSLLMSYGTCKDLKTIRNQSSDSKPQRGKVLGIETLFETLLPLLNTEYKDPGLTQERLRGAVLHAAVCETLGLSSFADNGQFPDIVAQALEIKLQLAGTIDLGLELPTSTDPVATLDGVLAAADVRYALFYADRTAEDHFKITSLVLTSGESFFEEFQQFQGLVSNAKIQLPLPADFFD